MAKIADRGSRVPADPNIGLELRKFLDDLARVPRNNYAAIFPPTVDDDATKNYSAGSLWFDIGAGEVYGCTANTEGAAVWKQLS